MKPNFRGGKGVCRKNHLKKPNAKLLSLELKEGSVEQRHTFWEREPLIGSCSLTDALSKTAVILPTKWLAKETFRFPYLQIDEWRIHNRLSQGNEWSRPSFNIWTDSPNEKWIFETPYLPWRESYECPNILPCLQLETEWTERRMDLFWSYLCYILPAAT